MKYIQERNRSRTQETITYKKKEITQTDQAMDSTVRQLIPRKDLERLKFLREQS
jgi:hypothetical protein